LGRSGCDSLHGLDCLWAEHGSESPDAAETRALAGHPGRGGDQQLVDLQRQSRALVALTEDPAWVVLKTPEYATQSDDH